MVPLVWTTQTALHIPQQTHFFENHYLNFYSRYTIIAGITLTQSHTTTYITYLFTQLSELMQCGMNKPDQASK